MTVTITIVLDKGHTLFIPGGEITPQLGTQLCVLGQQYFQEQYIEAEIQRRGAQEAMVDEDGDPLHGMEPSCGLPIADPPLEQGKEAGVGGENTIPFPAEPGAPTNP